MSYFAGAGKAIADAMAFLFFQARSRGSGAMPAAPLTSRAGVLYPTPSSSTSSLRASLVDGMLDGLEKKTIIKHQEVTGACREMKK